MVIAALPFNVQHLRQMKHQERFSEAVELVESDCYVAENIVSPWSLTFIDPVFLGIYGCFGVVDITGECWALVDDTFRASRAHRAEKVAVARACGRVLDAREEFTGFGCWARAAEGQDQKFLTTIGFQPHGHFFVRGKLDPRKDLAEWQS